MIVREVYINMYLDVEISATASGIHSAMGLRRIAARPRPNEVEIYDQDKMKWYTCASQLYQITLDCLYLQLSVH